LLSSEIQDLPFEIKLHIGKKSAIEGANGFFLPKMKKLEPWPFNVAESKISRAGFSAIQRVNRTRKRSRLSIVSPFGEKP
jgi:hypothetical protein